MRSGIGIDMPIYQWSGIGRSCLPTPSPTDTPRSPRTARRRPPSAPMPPVSAPGLMSLAAGVGCEKDAGRGTAEMGGRADRLGAGGVCRLLLRSGASCIRAHRRPGPTCAASLFALNGFLALVALAALLGVWFGRAGGN